MAVPSDTARLSFRELTQADLANLAGQLGDPRVMWMVPEPWSRETCADWIATNIALYRERGFGSWLLADRATGAYVGECGFGPEQVEGVPEIEIGYNVVPERWGQGLASEAGRACLDFAASSLGLARVIALIDPRNDRSMRTAEAIGMAFEREAVARNKRYVVYAIALAQPR